MKLPPFVRTIRHWHEITLALAVLLLLGWARMVDPAFVSWNVQIGLSGHAWELALLALPMTLIILAAGIDLSVGSTMALSAVVLGLSHEAGWPIALGAALALLTGAAAGAANGTFVTTLGVHPLIVTLATMAAFRGTAEGISMARPISGFPESFAFLGRGAVLGLPVPGVCFLVACLATAFLLRRTHSGQNLYAIGFNERAARASGLPVAWTKFTLYTLSGAAAGLAAVLYVARRNTAKADIGTGMELDVVTAVVLGGTSIFGGRGSLGGTLLGVLLIHQVREFVRWHWNRDELVFVVIGTLLILSVGLHTFLSRKRG